MTSPHSEAKARIRREARARRVAFVERLGVAGRRDLEGKLAVVLSPIMEQAKAVAGYHAIGSEIDLRSALRWAGEHHVEILLPAFASADGAMIFRGGAAAETGPHGIPQPPDHSREVEPDLVLVPLLAVDGAGTRLGQGGGHYDRILATLRSHGAILIGVGWPLQRVAFDLPRDDWDVPLDGFASPDGLEMFR